MSSLIMAMQFQVIGFTLGSLLAGLGVFGLLPALLDMLDGHNNAVIFLLSALVSAFLGGGMMIAHKDFNRRLTVRQAFLLTTLGLIFASLFAALPLFFSDLPLTLADAYFEAMSGITTTGATVLSEMEYVSRGILLWRSMLQWLGGIGVLLFAILLLPQLEIGGRQFFREEGMEHSEKPVSRVSTLIVSILVIYGGLTFICMICYHLGGMGWFNALNHAMTTISTGGFSTYSQNFAAFESPALHWFAIIFMLSGAIPFILYVRFLFQGKHNFLHDSQVRSFFIIIAVVAGALAFWLWSNGFFSIYESVHQAVFHSVSLLSTTGYRIADYDLWGGFPFMLTFFLLYIGGCTGSTAGGIKIMRLIITFKILLKHMNTLIFPSGVFTASYQGRTVTDKEGMAVLGFLGLYVTLNVVLTAALTLTGLDFLSSVSGVAASIANIGPGLGNIIGPNSAYGDINDPAKILLSFGMMAGRLEILTIAVLLAPRFWRA